MITAGEILIEKGTLLLEPLRLETTSDIDPTQVTRTALKNASSNASLMLRTEAMIYEVVEEDD
jgi:chaperonin GroEL (HSP60 family)